MNIYMIRHGRQRSALCNVNVELSEEGHRQAQLVGERLQSYGIDGLYATHLIRAVQTAGHISECLNLPVTEMDYIHEIDYGEWEISAIPAERAEQPVTSVLPKACRQLWSMPKRKDIRILQL